MNFKQFYNSGLYVQIARHMIDPQKLLKRKLFHLVDESNIGENCLTHCCQYGHLELFKRLIKTYKTEVDLVAVAIEHDQVKILEYLYNDQIELKHIKLAVESDALSVLKFLYDKKPELFTEDLLDSTGSIESIRFLYDRDIKYKVDENGYLFHLEYCAAYDNRLDIVKFLCEQHPDADLSNTYYNSISYGSIDNFKYLREEKGMNEYDGTAGAFVDACRNGYIDIVKYLYEHTDIRFSDEVIVEAIHVAYEECHKETAIYILNNH